MITFANLNNDTMKKSTLLLMMVALLGMFSCKSSYLSYTATAEVNGQKLFYAVEGRVHGKPVVLLHGNGGSHSDLETTHRQLAQKGYCVYALDSRGQGANLALKEYHYKDMAEDTYQFINLLKLHQPAVFGWSDGGNIALQMEVMHPQTCGVIITSGANITPDNAIDEKLFHEIFGNDTTKRPPLVEMMYKEPNMTKEDMQSITCPTLICAGEHDLILESHTRMIAENIPNGELCIVPGADHGSHIWHNLKMGTIIMKFLKKKNY